MNHTSEKLTKCSVIIMDAIFELVQTGNIGGEKAIVLTKALEQEDVSKVLNKILVEFASLQDDYDSLQQRNEDLIDRLAEQNRNLNLKIQFLDVSKRVKNILIKEDIAYVGELVRKTEAEVIKIPNLGMKSLSEIKNVLLSMGLKFGCKVTGWEP